MFIYLKQHLLNILEYNEEHDEFLHLTSKYLPIVSKFIHFWNENIIINESEIEMEIDELSTIYIQCNSKSTIPINDQIILGLIKHYFPEVMIEDNKYLINIGCKLWNKGNDITNAVQLFKEKCIKENYVAAIPLYNIYEFYCQNAYSIQNKMVVSKKYFEKFFIDHYNEFLDEKNFVIPTFWLH